MRLRLRRWILGGLAALGLGAAASEIWPDRAAGLMLSGLNLASKLDAGRVEASFGPVHYLEGGQGETVVFLHGIYALKEHWVDMSRQISGDYRVILLDLPGFGQNPRLGAEAYDFDRQAQNVVEALDKIGVEQFHIAANSMAAQIAGQLAAQLGERVRSVAFIGSPVGVRSPVRSDMEVALSEGHRPLVVTNAAQYADRMAWLFPKKPFVPRPVARSWAAAEVANAEINLVIWDAVHGSSAAPLEEIAPSLTQPTLVVWCRQDRIFHVSGAEVLDAALPDNRLIVPDGCGHLPMLDRAAQTGRDLLSFLKGLEGRS